MSPPYEIEHCHNLSNLNFYKSHANYKPRQNDLIPLCTNRPKPKKNPARTREPFPPPPNPPADTRSPVA